MTVIFVDTSALIAINHSRDQFHHQAITIFRRLLSEGYHFVTTQAIILELGNAFSAVSATPIALQLIDQAYNSPHWTVIPIDEPLFAKGLARFRQMDDKNWSLIDCISMVVAAEMGITEIFTNDHHFEQAGFVRLLT